MKKLMLLALASIFAGVVVSNVEALFGRGCNTCARPSCNSCAKPSCNTCEKPQVTYHCEPKCSTVCEYRPVQKVRYETVEVPCFGVEEVRTTMKIQECQEVVPVGCPCFPSEAEALASVNANQGRVTFHDKFPSASNAAAAPARSYNKYNR